MRTTIDAAGRVVVPKRLRDKLGLNGGAEIEIEDAGDRIEITKVPRPGRLVESEFGILTFAPDPNRRGLNAEEVRDALERSREWPRE